MADGLLGYGGERLVAPLAQLLKCSKLSTSISAATALVGILVKLRPKSGVRRSEDGIWLALEDADALDIIVRIILEDHGSSGKDAAFLELLAVILERWPRSRYRVACVDSIPSTLLLKCKSSNFVVARWALRALTALALCGCAATLELRDVGKMWSTIAICLHSSMPHNVQVEALRLLTSLCKVSCFGASFTGPHVEGIAAGCSRALEQGRSCGGLRWSPEVELLVMEAAYATSSVLSWPGTHHINFLQNGIERSLLLALSGQQNNRGSVNNYQNDEQLQPQVVNYPVERRSRGNRLNPRFRPLLWEAVGWLGAHCNKDLEPSPSQTTSRHVNLSGKLPALACAALLKALHRRGQNPSWFERVPSLEVEVAGADAQGNVQEEHPISAQEVVQICKAVLLLLSSPSHAIASCTKRCLEDAVLSHGLDWLPSIMKTLALAGSHSIKIDHLQTMTNILALACLSWIGVGQEQLLQFKALETVLEIAKAHADNSNGIKTEQLTAMGAMAHSVGARTCCISLQSWEGNDSILFSALWALFRLLQGSDWAKEIRACITEHLLDNLTWSQIKDGDSLQLFWKLAGDKTRASGIRWWSACCLACFGVYGFPSIFGRDMKRAKDYTSLADVIFLLDDGQRSLAHGVMLAVRGESLLPADVLSKLNARPVPSDLSASMNKVTEYRQNSRVENAEVSSAPRSDLEVHVSPRLTHKSLKILLDFVYTGIVYIPLDLVAEMKLLARRCNLEPLTSLLQGKPPAWGQPPAPCDLTLALGRKGFPMADILLLAEKPTGSLPGNGCRECSMVADHLPAHRFVLSARCDYFRALFRSGMRDSAEEEMKLSASRDTVAKFLQYLYSGKLMEDEQEAPDCAWRSLGTKSQLGFLQALVDLAELAGQWVLEELQQLTWTVIGAYLEQNVHLCPPILSLAADKQQWALVDTCATSLAPIYPQLRDSGAFDNLDEGLTDLVRAAHVKLSMMGKLEQVLAL